jgi:hypothetical protein
MPGFEDRLRRGLERAAQPAEGTGAFESIRARKRHRRMVRKVQASALTVVVLAGTGVGTYGLVRAFGGGTGRREAPVRPRRPRCRTA